VQIIVSPRARQQLSQLDASLRDELINRVAALADDPISCLRRSSDPLFPGLSVSSYPSDEVPGLVVTMYFDGYHSQPMRLRLVHVSHTARPPEEV